MEHAYTIETFPDSAVRWHLEVRPSTTKRSAQRACEREISIQVIVEILAPTTEEQLEFDF